jgi:hypothetical protein
MELLLFRLGDRGYASPRERVREVVDVGAGQPAIPGLAASSLGGLGGGQRPVALVSLRVALGLPDRGPRGASWSWPPGPARSASWSTRWCGCCATTRPCAGPGATRASGYVTASFSALGGGSWLLIDWDAIRLPTAITAPR